MTLLCGRKLREAFVAAARYPVRQGTEDELHTAPWTFLGAEGTLAEAGRPVVLELVRQVNDAVLRAGGVCLVLHGPVDLLPFRNGAVTHAVALLEGVVELPSGGFASLGGELRATLVAKAG